MKTTMRVCLLRWQVCQGLDGEGQVQGVGRSQVRLVGHCPVGRQDRIRAKDVPLHLHDVGFVVLE